MNFRAIIVFFVIFSGNVNCDAQSFQQDFIKCLEISFLNHDIEINSLLDSYEIFLIEKKYLKKDSISRYHKFLKKMEKENMLISTVPENIFEQMSRVDLILLLNECIPKDKTSNFEDYGFYARFIAARIDYKTNVYNESFEFKEFASILLEHFSNKDLEKPFFRAFILLLLGNSSLQEDGSIPNFKVLPPINEQH